jgi:hypothetical protein
VYKRQYQYPTRSRVYRINAFLFSYVNGHRSKFPFKILTFLGENKYRSEVLNSIYLEQSSYFLAPEFYGLEDGSTNPTNTNSKALTPFPYNFLELPVEFDFSTASSYTFMDFTTEGISNTFSFKLINGINKDIIDYITIVLPIVNSIRGGTIDGDSVEVSDLGDGLTYTMNINPGTIKDIYSPVISFEFSDIIGALSISIGTT